MLTRRVRFMRPLPSSNAPSNDRDRLQQHIRACTLRHVLRPPQQLNLRTLAPVRRRPVHIARCHRAVPRGVREHIAIEREARVAQADIDRDELVPRGRVALVRRLVREPERPRVLCAQLRQIIDIAGRAVELPRGGTALPREEDGCVRACARVEGVDKPPRVCIVVTVRDGGELELGEAGWTSKVPRPDGSRHGGSDEGNGECSECKCDHGVCAEWSSGSNVVSGGLQSSGAARTSTALSGHCWTAVLLWCLRVGHSHMPSSQH
ncbi:hypothetical protein C8Q72DRAFT_820143 [Fomitopsis betulina]|nr:hypothetical protein C8Q72DRAFT_820143 [Fomitopsis betulina]